MKIKKINIHNFKNLKSVEANLNGKSVYVTGKNGQGKTSFIQAIFSTIGAVDGPVKAIMDGEERAKVSLVIGNEEKEIIIEKSFSEGSPNGKLTIKSPDGATYPKPAQFIEQLIGSVNFDMEKFLLLKNQKEMLNFMKDFLKIDTDEIDEASKIEYNERTVVNRQIKEFTEQLKIYEDAVEVVVEDASILREKSAKRTDHLRKVQEVELRIVKGTSLIDQSKSKIEEYEVKLVEIQKMLEEERVTLNELNKTMSDVKTEKDNLLQQLEMYPDPALEIEEHNKKVELANKYAKKLEIVANLEAAKEKSEQHTRKLTDLSTKRNELFVSTGIANITITEDDIYYKGLPLDRNQINTAQLSELAIDIILAVNPTLKAVKFDASTMDKETYQRVLEKIEKHGFQCFIEEVDKDGGELKIEVIEKA
jgi:DNA repair exonuclease SbcCD ATPase subunit